METPSNPILHREVSDGTLISQVVYENESLKIEVETLREKLESTGLLNLDKLRCENEALKGEVGKLRMQLSERASQLALHRASNDRFSNIDQSLHELLAQVQTQRAELSELKESTRRKDARIAQITAQLKQSEKAMKDAMAQATTAATQSGAQVAEQGRLQTQLNRTNEELEKLQESSKQEVKELQNRLKEAQEQLLAMKKEIAAKSHIWGKQVCSQDQEIASLRERETKAQQQVTDFQAKMRTLIAECSQLRDVNANLIRKHQNELQQQQQKAAMALASRRVDLYAPEVQAHVEKAVRRATESVERQLREQTEHNATLLSRVTLLQQESERSVTTKGMSQQEVQLMKEWVNMRSRRNDARSTMQRRMAELLSNEVLSKEDIDTLLQEMLDYQEETDQENRTLLVIKDIESEEKERKLRIELKRVKGENASLMKQLRQLTRESLQRERGNPSPPRNNGVVSSEVSTPEVGSSTVAGAPTGGAGSSTSRENEQGRNSRSS
ncbi:conserved hypothetical protein [Leishmania braziliensis MHOM/BR/75/M2904]|uniref:Uncharacterized protein n=2 Tax=Leishmania braziliensis TaxID=5660 RepID=A4HAN5_LEIBR|nr:conserved hypothetical protein [Leishmania braziliensis MHOM/BR/75/M2904]KAI5686385.1 hypothetical protein MNV84_02956 [Leishmania braziliensis]CAJ2471137.1 unnamed protein product [Leishmania braziliensis]CAJ2471748.1 unnamed protein product [Leishmania braziliensis]CAM38467.1 conserved hypothetical protein [Leishmania braziliensis MHOM/BR/75/M2904]SYZ65101.1 hypothetical_protein [Leishmania braziliensis MHOM/BR/75/M2904]